MTSRVIDGKSGGDRKRFQLVDNINIGKYTPLQQQQRCSEGQKRGRDRLWQDLTMCVVHATLSEIIMEVITRLITAGIR